MDVLVLDPPYVYFGGLEEEQVSHAEALLGVHERLCLASLLHVEVEPLLLEVSHLSLALDFSGEFVCSEILGGLGILRQQVLYFSFMAVKRIAVPFKIGVDGSFTVTIFGVYIIQKKN